MPLTPPPDYTKVLAACIVGLTLALVTWQLTKSTLPIVGDRDHLLPHGGLYRDGTKTINYFAPGKLNSLEGSRRGFKYQPWGVVIALVAVIIFFSRNQGSRCRHCGSTH